MEPHPRQILPTWRRLGEETSRHFSRTFGGDKVAHALVGAASALMPTLGPDRVSVRHPVSRRVSTRHARVRAPRDWALGEKSGL